MWHALENEIGAFLGRPYRILDRDLQEQSARRQIYRLSDGKLSLLVKIGDTELQELLKAQAFGLAELSRFGPLRTPEVVCVGATKGFSYLVMEWLNMEEPSRLGWQRLGEGLAALHQRQDQAKYGFDQDNFIGDNPQPNPWHKHWYRFFGEQRLAYQLELLAEKGQALVESEALLDCAGRLLKHHQPSPSLLHGDLWRGNVGFVDDQPVVFDPACYYGDREVDLAMTELFGRFDPDFYAAYDDDLALDEQYESRRELYNLYHLLNHANLFGGPYLAQAQQSAKRLLDLHRHQ
ncbi:fructosamine kinase family protein [Gallaecimonas kandeliae]|uniref:fructosamine kinase family protein n=1 Tax=Gallaecimonas kandeliae TaxID=3029055 RepID=UPI002649BC05|nr:fructosamine kinase family protein [Gallaecimonas kandeliae]WKE63957.1 fructosamine kinase family protein [Gallaecimonas kandeliae]